MRKGHGMPDLWESCELCLREEGSQVGTEGNRLAFQLEELQLDTRRDSCLSQVVECSSTQAEQVMAGPRPRGQRAVALLRIQETSKSHNHLCIFFFFFFCMLYFIPPMTLNREGKDGRRICIRTEKAFGASSAAPFFDKKGT